MIPSSLRPRHPSPPSSPPSTWPPTGQERNEKHASCGGGAGGGRGESTLTARPSSRPARARTRPARPSCAAGSPCRPGARAAWPAARAGARAGARGSCCCRRRRRRTGRWWCWRRPGGSWRVGGGSWLTRKGRASFVGFCRGLRKQQCVDVRIQNWNVNRRRWRGMARMSGALARPGQARCGPRSSHPSCRGLRDCSPIHQVRQRLESNDPRRLDLAVLEPPLDVDPTPLSTPRESLREAIQLLTGPARLAASTSPKPAFELRITTTHGHGLLSPVPVLHRSPWPHVHPPPSEPAFRPPPSRRGLAISATKNFKLGEKSLHRCWREQHHHDRPSTAGLSSLQGSTSTHGRRLDAQPLGARGRLRASKRGKGLGRASAATRESSVA